MGCSGILAWTLCVLLCWMCVDQAVAEPQYLVAIPAVIEAGAETKFCASLLQPSEILVMTVTLRVSREENTTLLTHTSNEEFHICAQFKAPLVEREKILDFEVEVRGDIFHSKEVRKVLIKAYKARTFIQTDKPIYLPGQTVHFRVITLDTKLRPASQQYKIIEVEDSNRNRIGQWLNETSNSKILQLSYSLNSEAREGMYNIIVSVDDNKLHHRFKVEKYVLPKFDVTLNASDEVSIGQEKFYIKVCAKHTYGQPVPGNVTVKVCRPLQHCAITKEMAKKLNITAICHSGTKQADETGCAAVAFEMSAFTKIDQRIIIDELNVSANMEEEGTGISHRHEKRIRISYVIGKVSFIDMPKIWEPGSNVEGKVKAVYYNGTPIPEASVYLFETATWTSTLLQNLTTDSNGVALFSLSTNNFNEDIIFQASLAPTLKDPGHRTEKFQTGFHRVPKFQPPQHPYVKTASSLEVKRKDKPLHCDKEEDISIQYTVLGEAPGSMDVIYLVLSRGAIVMQGFKPIEIKDQRVNEGEVSFKLRISPDMAPAIKIVAYTVLDSENVIAHTADFSTEKCFSNKVSLEFTPSSAVPGEKTTMQVTALPHSLCALKAIDKSVLIKEPRNILDADKIFYFLPLRELSYIPYQIEEPRICLNVRTKRYSSNFPDIDGAYKVFKSVGLKMATNLLIRIPSCVKFKGRDYHHNPYGYHVTPLAGQYTPQMSFTGHGSLETTGAFAPPVETVRTFFPETWIWDLVDVGDSGTKDVSLTVPDALTTWETEAFCLSSQGFGLAPRQEVKVFQPFFLELTMPYSIIRGEHFELKATVFNYLTSCIMLPGVILRENLRGCVKNGNQFKDLPTQNMWSYPQWRPLVNGAAETSLAVCHIWPAIVLSDYFCPFQVTVFPTPSADYNLTPLSGDQYTSCLCASERKTVSWTMTPTVLGSVNVTISAEAVPSHVSCDTEAVSVPERGRIDVVSKSLIIKAEGTEMTKTFSWLFCPKGDTLTEKTEIQLPENVIQGSARTFVSVLGDILGRALKNLDGLLQMPYGCGEQNMALLAPNIYILQYLKGTQQLTPAIMEKATNFLTSGYQRQLNYKSNEGAYTTFGTGPGNTWLTAFVVKSFAKAQSFIYIDPRKIEESKVWLEHKQGENGCFEKSGKLFNNRMKGGVSDEVTLSAYITAAFLEMNISQNDPVVNKSLACLKESISDLSNTYTTALLAYVFTLVGDMETRARLLQHLDTVAVREGGFLYWFQTATETSASLSVEISSYVLLAKLSAFPTAEDLGYTTDIIRWLSGQQNYYGGFSSTQDTVVALQALALYSTLVFSPEGSSTVTVQSPSSQLIFDVNQGNKLLYQEETMPDMSGKYSLEVKGTACASVQISVHYNIPTPTDVTTLSVEVKPEVDATSESPRPKLTLKIKCLYSGKENTTNMVILDIKMLSGFVPHAESLKMLKGAPLVDRAEQTEDHVLVYLQELPKEIPVNYSLMIIQELPVENLKPAMIKIYDYYQPSDQAETEYIYPSAAA